ncbi:hypothetical protein DCS_00494 [Drechmeria coniospora]|uniref:Glycosyltransferase family 31 protein n=1 Tax=Drechmeria coniospora TaxID=98403 RepID=A0A151GQG4_DRECN|nr:hypothetical protein DCS_00494 [Drechmeria coniospora]KYK59364.1 hypothetical protein DCS_00494 [Drechmeria coniospora]ODA77664.1 hypothetical protein RJ55_06266 [Drechmeria coniospora]
MFVTKGLSALHTRPNTIFIFVLVVLLLIQAKSYYRPAKQVPIPVELKDAVDGEPSAEESFFKHLVDTYRFTNLTTWQAWRIQATEQKDEASSLTAANYDFHSQAERIINVNAPNRTDLHASRKLLLPTRRGARMDDVDGSPFLFGISTTFERIADRDWALVRSWKRWMTHHGKASNGADLVLMLNKATDQQLYELDAKLHEASIDVYALSTEDSMSMARRYYEITRIMKTYSATLAASGQRKRWFALVDDSVFFPGLSYLNQQLSAYDSDEKLFIGLPDERGDWYEADGGLTTSGGGALLLTRSALNNLPRLPCFQEDEQVSSRRPRKWDVLLSDCMKKHARLDMHVMAAAFSPYYDVPSDPAGHEMGTRPLVLHDYGERHRIDPGLAHLVTDACGEGCFMQRYLFHDNWLVVNGVSISQNPDGLAMSRIRIRNYRAQPPRTRITGPLVMDDSGDGGERAVITPKGRRNVWKLLDSVASADGTVWQAYLKRGQSGLGWETDGVTSMDSIIVLAWESSSR